MELSLLCLLLPLFPLPITWASECFRSSQNCSACLQAGPRCAWDPHSDPAALWRCSSRGSNAPADLFFPVSSFREKVPNREYHVDLRLHDEVSFTVDVQLEKTAAVDIYILSDMTFSMKDYLKEVGRTAKIILNNIEKQAGKGRVRLGFGGFVDKPMIPFVNKYGAASCNTASENAVVCEEPYSYRHVLNFTTEDARFQEVVKKLGHSVSLDKQDGGLEALLQVAVCPDFLGWNPKALKIVAFLTSSGIHIQGDGLLAGIAENADLRCHMGITESGQVEFLKAKELDYPSIGLVSEALEQAGITVIFLAKKSVLPLFRRLSEELPSASAAQLPENKAERSEEEAEIASILSRSYEQITRLVTFDRMPDKFASHVETAIFAQCEEGGTWLPSSECGAARLGALVRFRVVVRLRQCLPGAAELHFQSSGLEDALVRLRVTSLCSCASCGKKEPADECGPTGHLQCGVCSCPPDRQGVRCECAAGQRLEARCKEPQAPQAICSGRGVCSCGKCYCEEGFGGPFCSCLARCPKDAIFQRVCGGSARGSCGCDNHCKCSRGYAGEACDCLKAGDGVNCTERESRAILERPDRACSNSLFRRCVLCHFSKTPPGQKNADEACRADCSGNVKIKVTMNETVSGDSICVVDNEDIEDCRILVFHQLKADQLTLVIARDCDYAVVHQAALPLFVVVVVCVLLVGLLLIGVWKLVVHFEDRAEYQRLEQEQWKGETNFNPLYKSPETEVKNPLFQDEQDLS